MMTAAFVDEGHVGYTYVSFEVVQFHLGRIGCGLVFEDWTGSN